MELRSLAELLAEAPPRVVVVVGAGVSINATGLEHASWLGLLKHAVGYLSRERFQPQWGTSLEASLDAAFKPFDLHTALQHAELVEQALKTPSDLDFSRWLHDAFMRFAPSDEDSAQQLLNALRDLHADGALLLTTNYDSLLCDVTGVPPVTWEEHDDFLRVATRQKAGILHVHGHWKRATSVVLGRSSYERVAEDADFQQLFRSLWLDWTWVYVGCGDGINDPNLGRLLKWGSRWGAGALPHYFLARQDKAEAIASGTKKPANLHSIGYPSHADLARTLRSLAPTLNCSPFIRVNEALPLFRVVGSSAPFPSQEEYLCGSVPATAADAEVESRLRMHGWACIMDVASVGKTTLALRVASTKAQRNHPAFYLDLRNETPDDSIESPAYALHRIWRAGTLVILDNIQHQPELARELWQQWAQTPRARRGLLLLIATRIHQPVIVSAAADLLFFERHPSNPSIPIGVTPVDLGNLANFIRNRMGNDGAAELAAQPPPEALAQWHADYRVALGAFSFAVANSLASFQTGSWSLPVTRASAWVREKWLDRLGPAELENMVCLAAFGADDLELLVQREALPYPEKTARLFKLGLVAEVRRGKLKEFEQLGLREGSWANLILAALDKDVNCEAVRSVTAARHPIMATLLSSRLRRAGRHIEHERLWATISTDTSELGSRVWEVPISTIEVLVHEARQANCAALLSRIWDEIESDPGRFAECAFNGSLPAAASLIAVAKEQRRDAECLWAAIENQPNRIAERVWTAPLDQAGAFLSMAKRHGRETGSLWDAIESKPLKLLAQAFAGRIDCVASFMKVAKEQDRDTKALWSMMESQPDELAARAHAAPLDRLGRFLRVAKEHGRDTTRLWDAIEGLPDELAVRARETPLARVGFFLETASEQNRNTELLWRAIENPPDELTARALATPLDELGSFLKVARAHGRDTKSLWEKIECDPRAFADIAWSTPIADLGFFLGVAKEQGRDTARLWSWIEAEPDKLLVRVLAAPLDQLCSFLGVAEDHGRDMGFLWNALEGDRVTLVTKVQSSSLGSVASFIGTARSAGRNTDTLWRMLEEPWYRLAERSATATLTDLVPLAHHAPTQLLKAAFHSIRPGHWSSTPASTGLIGATWIAQRMLTCAREELASDLIELLLRRANWRDFPAQAGGFGQACWLLANAPSTMSELCGRFIDNVCTHVWLGIAYAQGGCGQIAGGLRQLALGQTVERCRRFHHSQLGRRLNEELSRFEQADPTEQSQVVQLMGCASLCGWRISARSIASIPRASVVALPVHVHPHDAESDIVDDYQIQLWLGLRVFVSVTRTRLSVPLPLIQDTLRRWRRNLAKTESMPDSAARRLDGSMVSWLETCAHPRTRALVASREPLWTLLGVTN